jgi:prepilin-type N-terminal cleavage/methylation domain-containing protein
MKIPFIRCRRAFTLVEIMIVVLVVGLLSTIAIAAIHRIKARATSSLIQNNLRQLYQAKVYYYSQSGSFQPVTVAELAKQGYLRPSTRDALLNAHSFEANASWHYLTTVLIDEPTAAYRGATQPNSPPADDDVIYYPTRPKNAAAYYTAAATQAVRGSIGAAPVIAPPAVVAAPVVGLPAAVAAPVVAPPAVVAGSAVTPPAAVMPPAVVRPPTPAPMSESVATDFSGVAITGHGGTWDMVDPAIWGWHTDNPDGKVEYGKGSAYGDNSGGNIGVIELEGAAGTPSNLYRDIATQPGATYRFSFDLSGRTGVSSESASVQVFWEGKLIATVAPAANTFALHPQGYNLVATQAGSRIELRAVTQDGTGPVVDNLAMKFTGLRPPGSTP